METAGEDAGGGIPGPGEETWQVVSLQQVSHAYRKQYCQKMTESLNTAIFTSGAQKKHALSRNIHFHCCLKVNIIIIRQASKLKEFSFVKTEKKRSHNRGNGKSCASVKEANK